MTKISRVLTGTLHRTPTRQVVFTPADASVSVRSVEPVRRPAKVARMLALAHHLQNAFDQGRVRNRVAIAWRLGIAESRLSQVLNLLRLAPDIQLDVLRMGPWAGWSRRTRRR